VATEWEWGTPSGKWQACQRPKHAQKEIRLIKAVVGAPWGGKGEERGGPMGKGQEGLQDSSLGEIGESARLMGERGGKAK